MSAETLLMASSFIVPFLVGCDVLGDMWTRRDDEDEEPDWVKEERNQFLTYRDKNSDGIMDRDEVKEWIIPDDYDHADSEARHLIHEADKNQVSTIFVCIGSIRQ